MYKIKIKMGPRFKDLGITTSKKADGNTIDTTPHNIANLDGWK